MAKFTGVSASAGIAIIVPGTGGGHPTLWNPEGSNVTVAVRRLALSYVSGNNAPTAIEWAFVDSAGSASATGAPIATATVVASVGYLGRGSDAKARWSPTVNTFTAAPVFTRPTGLSLFTGVAATAVAPFTMIASYEDDEFILDEGTAVCLCSQAATTTALFQVGVTWEEVAI